MLPVELDELHRRRVFQFDALSLGELFHAVVEVRQMVGRDVVQKHAVNVRVALISIPPVDEQDGLRHQQHDSADQGGCDPGVQ